MISYLKGKIKSKDEKSAILEVGGVGYQVFIPHSFLEKIKVAETIEVYTHLYLREETLELYGFKTQEELKFFKELISVSGIGPKSALAVLSIASLKDLKAAIASGDSSLLTKVSGIGKKMAQRIIVELKPKYEGLVEVKKTRERIEEEIQVIEALIGLGYSRSQAQRALEAVPKKVKGVEMKIKETLKILGRR